MKVIKKSIVGHRKGFTMIELAFVLVIAGLIISLGLTAFNKMYSPTVANNEYSKAMQVIGAVERAAGDSGGTYPQAAAGTAVSATVALSNQMGGNTNDLAGWRYGCPAGGTTATITSNALSSNAVAGLLATKITSSSPNWIAGSSGNVVTITKNSILCN